MNRLPGWGPGLVEPRATQRGPSVQSWRRSLASRLLGRALALATACGAAPALLAQDKPAVPGQDGFVIQSEDGAYRLRVAGYAQLAGRFYLHQEAQAATDSFVLRRARPIFQGTVASRFDFYLDPDFGLGQAALLDGYLDARFSSAFRVRAGKFKAPFGVERLQSGSALLFIERALPTGLAPNRDVGVQVHGELAGGTVAYAMGVFNGVADGGSADADSNNGKDLGGRLWLQPLRRGQSRKLRNLGFGVAVTHGRQEGTLPSYKSGGQLTFFGYGTGVGASGVRTRISPQAVWSLGPVAVLGEWVTSSQGVRHSATATSLKLTHQAWQVALALALTGEDTRLGSVTPARAFDPGHGWGALELAGRLNGFEVDADTFAAGLADRARSAQSARALGVGLNWYLNRHVKYSVDFERTTFAGGATAGANRQPENALLFQSQVSF